MNVDESVYCASGSFLAGDVSAGPHCSFWFGSVVRAEDAPAVIGIGTNVQDNCTLHTDAGFPLHVGDNVSVGHNAVLHGCTVGSNTVIGMGAVVMNGARIGKDSIVAAGALVPQGKSYADGMLIMGMPAKAIRKLSAEEIAENMENAHHYVNLACKYRTGQIPVHERAEFAGK